MLQRKRDINISADLISHENTYSNPIRKFITTS